jgi:hypothetical protein
MTYGENYALWVGVRITASSSVGGTESSTFMDYLLIGSSEDYSNENIAPAGDVSPFGVSTSCANPN